MWDALSAQELGRLLGEVIAVVLQQAVGGRCEVGLALLKKLLKEFLRHLRHAELHMSFVLPQREGGTG